eukprot:TRINITY_DN80081_c0_g1_i2.p2 TRINITY_DN80081_c0_g1~~TRINITY_DN80081_c0_g1_i2.p2  ORF type:complete len:116 (-),score=24.10 TRINITY_DN80081_c0_g1_i2:90-413(-)
MWRSALLFLVVSVLFVTFPLATNDSAAAATTSRLWGMALAAKHLCAGFVHTAIGTLKNLGTGGQDEDELFAKPSGGRQDIDAAGSEFKQAWQDATKETDSSEDGKSD